MTTTGRGEEGGVADDHLPETKSMLSPGKRLIRRATGVDGQVTGAADYSTGTTRRRKRLWRRTA